MIDHNPWESISVPSRDVSARRVDHKHPLSFFWAKDFQGRYLFFCEFPRDTILPSDFPDISGVDIMLTDKDKRLILVLKSASEWKIFHAICKDILEATKDIHHLTSSVSVIVQRLQRWQEFLRRSRSLLLSEEKIKGLIGELLFMRDRLLPAFGIREAVLSWQGPDGSPQDFEVNESAIEIKCQSGVSTPHVRISSEDQLCSQLPELYLHVYTLGRAVKSDSLSINLPALVSDLRLQIAAQSSDLIDLLNEKLFKAGYLDLDEYLDFNYINADEKTYLVKEGFPRICRNQLQEGVQKVKYIIGLSNCEPYRDSPEWMEG